jgi:uncharacterized repeat protein (TIGR01451 family)
MWRASEGCELSNHDGEPRRPRGWRCAWRVAGRWLALATLFLPSSASSLPYPGTPPTKVADGPEVRWGGTRYEVPPGGEILWTIAVVHDLAANPRIETSLADDVPDPADGLPVAPFDPATDVLARPSAGVLNYSGDTLTLNGVPMMLDERWVLTFRTRVLATATNGTVICNQGYVTYVADEDTGDPPGVPPRWNNRTLEPLGTDGPTCVVVNGGPSLAESAKTAQDATGDGVLEAGESVTYEITVRNTGNAAANDLVVTDTVEAALAIGLVEQGGVVVGSTIRWDGSTTPELVSLARGASTILRFVSVAGCVPDAAELCNQAVLSSREVTVPVPTDDPGTAALSDATCLPTAAPVLLRSPYTVADGNGDLRFDAAEGVTFTVVVTNAGAGAARDVAVEAPIPVEVIGVTPLDGGTLGASSVQWTPAGTPALASIAPGGAVTLRFTGTIDPGAPDAARACSQGILTTSAGCPADVTDDPASPGDFNPTCFNIRSIPEIAFTLTAADADGDGRSEPGELVEYEATITHVSGPAAQEVGVDLALPGATVLAGLVADDGGLVGPASMHWDPLTTPALQVLDAGETVVLTGRGTVACTAPDLLDACATGVLRATNLRGALASDDPGLPGTADPSCVTIASPVLSSTLTGADFDGNGQFDAGESVTLTLRVVNAGTAAARDVAVRLPLAATDRNVTASNGGVVGASDVTWDPATTLALRRIDPAGEVVLTVMLRIDGGAAGQRTCHQSTAEMAGFSACTDELSHDLTQSGPDAPTCWDVVGENLPPGEVPDGDELRTGPVPVRLACQGSDLLLTWSAAPRAATHLVYRGPLTSFLSRPWTNPAAGITDPENTLPSCDLAALVYVDQAECARGGPDHYFLVAGRNAVGDGPIGDTVSDGGRSPRPTVATPCP